MESSASTRLLRACREAGKPLPEFSPDDVVDFQVTEAIVLKAAEQAENERKEAAKQQQEDQTGKAGHRDPDFLERARAAE